MSQAATVRKHKPDLIMLLAMGILLLVGMLVMHALSPSIAKLKLSSTASPNYYSIRHLVSLGLGLSAFIAASQIPQRLWSGGFKYVMMALAVISSLAIAIPGSPFGVTQLGATRWFGLGPVTFQPVELIKFAMILYFAGFLARARREGKLDDMNSTFYPLTIILLIIGFVVVVLQKDMGSMMVILAMAASMLFVSGVPSKLLLKLAGYMIIPLILAIVLAPHRVSRIASFASSNKDCSASSYHICQSLIAIGSGGITGLGLGQSVQATGYLPEAGNDSIFAVYGEKFGFIGTTLLLTALATLCVRLLKIAEHTLNPTARMFCYGVFAWMSTHLILNIGAMLGILPIKGITLPLISSGGTSIVFIMTALGIVYHVSSYTTIQPIEDEAYEMMSKHKTTKQPGVNLRRYVVGSVRGLRSKSKDRKRVATHSYSKYSSTSAFYRGQK